MNKKLMSAIVCDGYRDLSRIKIKSVPVPCQKSDEILVKVTGATVTAGDWNIFNNKNIIIRFIFGLLKPRQSIFGSEFSGIVEEVGDAVTEFKKGDLVFGSNDFKLGSHAEYTCIKAKKAVTHAPNNIDLIKAAALSFGGCTALTFLNKVKIEKGCKILIYGASGAVGSAAVQIAEHFGADVTAVCSQKNSIYFKDTIQVLDYTADGYQDVQEKYDIIFDAVGKMSVIDRKMKLAENGQFLDVRKGLSSETKDKIKFIKKLVENNEFTPLIDSICQPEEIKAVYEKVGSGRKVGNILLKF